MFLKPTQAQSKILPLAEVQEKIAELRRINPNIRIGLTSGAFLVPHKGHFISFDLSKEHCDVLVVVMSSTQSLEKKGRMHPLAKSDSVRAERLARSRDSVDFVICNDASNAVDILQAIKPDVFLKGDEEQYRNMDHPEQKTVQAYGGKIVLTQMDDDRSITSKALIRKMVEARQRRAQAKETDTGPGLG